MHKEQTVSEMVEEVLTRQAKALVEQTGQPFQAALGPSPRPMLGVSLGS
jgi:hypothetical protein